MRYGYNEYLKKVLELDFVAPRLVLGYEIGGAQVPALQS
jgi:hypothetical protein